MTLMLHAGADALAYDDLRQLETPASTNRATLKMTLAATPSGLEGPWPSTLMGEPENKCRSRGAGSQPPT